MEIFNLFSGCVRQEGLSRLQSGQTRQSIVTDMRIFLPLGQGGAAAGRDGPSVGVRGVAMWGGVGPRPILHELKVVLKKNRN